MTGFATGRFVVAVRQPHDGPTYYPASGRVTFTKTVNPYPDSAFDPHGPAEVTETPVSVTLDDTGRIPLTELKLGRHRVVARLANHRRREFVIDVAPENTDDNPIYITMAESMTLPPSAIVVVKEGDRVRAEAAAVDSEASAVRSEAAADVATAPSRDMVQSIVDVWADEAEQDIQQWKTTARTELETLVTTTTDQQMDIAKDQITQHVENFTRSYADTSVKDRITAATANFVRGVGVQRMVVSSNVEEQIQQGDLLVVVDSPKFFTDFTGYPVNSTAHSNDDFGRGWVYRTFTIVSSSTATGGRCLRSDRDTGQERAALVFIPANTFRDIPTIREVVFKWRGESEQTSPRAVVCGRGSSGSESGYYFGRTVDTEGMTLGRYDDGSAAFTRSEPDSHVYTPGQWWVSRFRVDYAANFLGGRTWQHGLPEPTHWDVTRTRLNGLDTGWSGIMAFNSEQTDFDWLGFAFDGGRAPMGQ